MLELIRLFKQFRREKKEELIKQRLLKSWVKDTNYEMASQLFAIFTEKNSDVVLELKTPNGVELRIYRDTNGTIKEERLTEDEKLLGRRG